MSKNKKSIPAYSKHVEATYLALKELGGSGKNNEIEHKAVEMLGIDEDVLSIPHLNSSSLSEVNYRLAWARTLLKNYGAIENSARSVWAITATFSKVDKVDGEYIEKNCKNKAKSVVPNAAEQEFEEQLEAAGVEVPEEVRPWRKRLHDVLLNMNPYSFEKLAQRLLRECGFEDVVVTKNLETVVLTERES